MVFTQDIDLSEAESLPFYLAKLQVYLNEERWQEAATLLEAPHRSMVPSFIAGLRSALAHRLGDEVARLSFLQKALQQAKHSENFSQYLALFELGVRLQDRKIQRQTCEEFVRLPSRFLPGGQELSFLDKQFGAEPEFLVSLYQKLEAAKPDDALICYRKALLDFVVNGEVDESQQMLDSLLVKYPEASSIRCAKALILAESSPQEALRLAARRDSKQANLHGAFETAAYAYLLRANGNDSQARYYDGRVEWQILPAYLRNFFQQKRSLEN